MKTILETVKIMNLTPIFCYEGGCGRRALLHYHEYHEFVLCTGGHGRQYTDKNKYEIRVDDCFYFPVEQPHIAQRPEKGHLRVIVLYFYNNVFDDQNFSDAESLKILRFLGEQALKGKNRICLPKKHHQKLIDLFQRVKSELEKQDVGYLCAAKIVVQEILLMIARFSPYRNLLKKEFQPNHHKTRIDQLRTFLDNHFHDDITVEQMAKMSNMSRSHFQAVFKQETGKTLTQYLNHLKCRHASSLLRESDYSIIEISELSGFRTVSHFYSIFKQLTGLTPKEARNQELKRPFTELVRGH